MPRSLATAISAAATARTWVTPPGAPSTPAAAIVCTESTIEQPRLDRVDVAEHRGQVGLGGQVELVVQRADPLGAQPDLGGRLLAGDVRAPAAVPRGHAVRDVEQQGRLADAGLAGQQHDRAGHQAAAEHPVELGDAGRPGGGRRRVDLGDRRRAGRAADRRRRDALRPSPRRGARRTPRPCPRPGTPAQRPTHLADGQPHSVQRKPDPADDFSHDRTIAEPLDNLSKLERAPSEGVRPVSGEVKVPGPPVALSTASVYPECTPAAFEMAARLGYDGVEVMVWTDPVSQDADALRRLSDHYGVPILRDPRAVPADHPAGVGHRPVGQAASGPRRRPSASAPSTVVVHPPFRWQRDYAAASSTGLRRMARRPTCPSRSRTCSRGGPAAGRSRRTARTGTRSSSDYPHTTLDLSHTAVSGSDAAADGRRRSATGCATCTWPTASGSNKDEHLVPGRGGQPCAEVLERLAARRVRRHRRARGEHRGPRTGPSGGRPRRGAGLRPAQPRRRGGLSGAGLMPGSNVPPMASTSDHRRADRCRDRQGRRPAAADHADELVPTGEGLRGRRRGDDPRAHPRRRRTSRRSTWAGSRDTVRGAAREHRPDRPAVHRRRGARPARAAAARCSTPSRTPAP